MSASLVGSEMCIRDRLYGMGTATAEALHLQRLLAEAQLTSREPTLIPVSYTHLTLPTICSV
eukprot:489640-Alexandrium_andersonii.AAC.1